MTNICWECKQEFVGQHKNHRYCSRPCRLEADRKIRAKPKNKKRKQQWYLSVKQREQERSRRWYQAHRESEIKKNSEYRKRNRELFDWYHNRVRFDGLRDAILERDENRCQVCGTDETLVVHHIDGTGYASVRVGKASTSNNDADNLITLCNSHHHKLHHWQRKNSVLKTREDIVRTMAKVIEADGKSQR